MIKLWIISTIKSGGRYGFRLVVRYGVMLVGRSGIRSYVRSIRSSGIRWRKLLMNSFYCNWLGYDCNTSLHIHDQVNLQGGGPIFREVINQVRFQVWWHVRRTIDENIYLYKS
jgi:hypothetical protein